MTRCMFFVQGEGVSSCAFIPLQYIPDFITHSSLGLPYQSTKITTMEMYNAIRMVVETLVRRLLGKTCHSSTVVLIIPPIRVGIQEPQFYSF